MPVLKSYDLFISHAWTYNDEYYRLLNLLKAAQYFEFRNYSVPQHDPLFVNSDKALDDALIRQIKPVNIVLIISGMYVNHRRWIQREIEIAQSFNKPIIGVQPWGQLRTPLEVQNVSKIMVGWNTAPIVDAIRRYSI